MTIINRLDKQVMLEALRYYESNNWEYLSDTLEIAIDKLIKELTNEIEEE